MKNATGPAHPIRMPPPKTEKRASSYFHFTVALLCLFGTQHYLYCTISIFACACHIIAVQCSSTDSESRIALYSEQLPTLIMIIIAMTRIFHTTGSCTPLSSSPLRRQRQRQHLPQDSHRSPSLDHIRRYNPWHRTLINMGKNRAEKLISRDVIG